MGRIGFRFATVGTLATLAISLILPTALLASSPSKLLYKFKGGNDGEFPFSGIVFDAAKNLYGTTVEGGVATCFDGCGTVFKLKANADGGWTESVLYRFAGGTDGSAPHARLVFDAAGNLYGTTTTGGGSANCNGGCGTVFKLSASADGSWTESLLYSFSGGTDGGSPWGGLIFDKAGDLYGTTRDGGASGFGTVFKLTPNPDGSWTQSVLYSFCSLTACADGGQPVANLVFDPAGDLYGTASGGGGPGGGTVFELIPKSDGTWKESVLYSFCSLNSCRDGDAPTAELIFDKAGNLYSTTSGGGFKNGLVFKLKRHSDGKWTESVLYRFHKRVGIYPYAGLTFTPAGKLYGTTAYGGSGKSGIVFSLAPQSGGNWTFVLVHAFTRNGAQTPYAGSLVLDKAGRIYGAAEHCGNIKQCQGAVFQITP